MLTVLVQQIRGLARLHQVVHLIFMKKITGWMIWSLPQQSCLLLKVTINILAMPLNYGRKEPVTPWMGADSARHYQWYPFINMGHYQIASQKTDLRASSEFIRN